MIDVRAILVELGVDFKESGKNVGANDINIDCPYCGSSKHLGISLGNGFTFCWVCEFNDEEKHPSLLKVLCDSTDEDYGEIKTVMIEHGWEPFIKEQEKSDSGLALRGRLPRESKNFPCSMSYGHDSNYPRNYLYDRNFVPDKIILKYKLKYATEGWYKNRIIIPIYFNGELVSFTSRAYKGEGRYKHATLDMSSMRIKDVLYNYDTAKEFGHIYLLEGPTDVWRMGDDSLGVFRSKLTRPQRNLLVNLSKTSLTSLTIIFDYGAYSRALLAAEDLSPFISLIKVVRLPDKKDVADRTREEVLELERNTKIYIG